MKGKVKALVAILVAAAVLVSAKFTAFMPLSVETWTVQPDTATLTFTEQGGYHYGETYTVYPLVAGEVAEVRFQEGDAVKEGDVIALVNVSDYDYQIKQLESNITGYEGQITNLTLQEQQERQTLYSSLEELYGQLAKVEAEMRQNASSAQALETQIEIQNQIIETNQRGVTQAREDLWNARDNDDEEATISQYTQAYNTARNNLLQSELQLEQLLAGNASNDVYEVQRAAILAQIETLSGQMKKSYTAGMIQYYNAQIEATRANIEQMQVQAGQAEITAPVSGILQSLPIREQNVTTLQNRVAVIADKPQVEVFVPIREMDGIQNGDRVELMIDKRLGPETIGGVITDIDREAQVKTSALGVEERKVRVLVEPEDTDLIIGFEMDVRFTVYQQESALTVPKTAVFQQDGEDWVWLAENGKLKLRRVVKGLETRDGYIINEGLSPGAVVVRNAGDDSLAEGKDIAPETV